MIESNFGNNATRLDSVVNPARAVAAIPLQADIA